MANTSDFLSMRDLEVVDKVARAHRLTKSDTLVLAYAVSVLYDYRSADDGGRVAVSKNECAKETKLTRSTVGRSLQKLGKEGIMTLVEQGGIKDGKNMANVYELSDDFEPIKQRGMENLQIVTKTKNDPHLDHHSDHLDHYENQQVNNLLQENWTTTENDSGPNEKELLEAILLELRELNKRVESIETALANGFWTPKSKTKSNNSFVNVSCDNDSCQSRDENAREEDAREIEIFSENEIEVGSEPAASVGDARNNGDRESQIVVKSSDRETSSGASLKKRRLSAPEPQNELPLKEEGENLSGGKPEPHGAFLTEGVSAGVETYPQSRKQEIKIKDTPPPTPAPEKTLEEVLTEQGRMELEMFDDGNATVSTASDNATLDEFNKCMRIMYAYDPIKCYEETLDIRDKTQRCIDAMRAETPRPTKKQTKLFSELQRKLDEAWRKKEEYIEKYGGDKKDSLTPYTLLKEKFYDQCDEVCRCTDEKALTEKYDKANCTLIKMTALCDDAEDAKKLARHLERRMDEAKALIGKIKSYKPDPAPAENANKRHLSAPESQNELHLKPEGENPSGVKPEPQGASCGEEHSSMEVAWADEAMKEAEARGDAQAYLNAIHARHDACRKEDGAKASRGKVSDSEIERLYREAFVERTLDANTLPTDTLHALGKYAAEREQAKPKPYPDTEPLGNVIYEPASTREARIERKATTRYA